ncbi:class I SAM-dependent methyltransferase [Roseiconus lacunae]|uniref:class I SAM-dependent methyltransferase n=1 Tax=Roseiconus lacunae TaxID=2605694 RepID=UPI001E5D3460|nr:class I SAM-dependent methyltransferase [Roseiconus lacunae]MCD0460391.1 class I SAM-dependent methyltransferase [Roseiconus lacunae]
MAHQYTDAVASHYAAYRPPLHELILMRVIGNQTRFCDGLDVGCGTGRSSVALAKYCERVCAVDPSESMLAAAIPHRSIRYHQGSAEAIPIPDRSIDVVTFAGSLSYANRLATLKELARVCRADASIVPYDFSMLIDDVLRPFGLADQSPDSTYDHRAGFSGVSAVVQVLADQERISLEIEPVNLAHVLLADERRYDAFAKLFGTTLPLTALASALAKGLDAGKQKTIEANLFYSLYRFDR